MSDPAQTPRRDVLGSRHLLDCIFRGMQLGELAPLLRVSRFFFDVGAPLVWRELPGLEVLVKLFLEGRQDGEAPSRRRPAKISVSMVDPTVPGLAEKFARFNVYKGFVRKLCVYGGHLETFFVGDEERFRPQFVYQFEGFPTTEKPPLELPNLREVVVDRHQCPMTWEELRNVLCWFVGSSCISVGLSGSFKAGRDDGESGHGGGDVTGLAEALETAFGHRSSLRALQLWLQPNPESWGEGSALAEGICTMPFLTTLLISPFMLGEPLFLAIAALPALQTLRLGSPGLAPRWRADPSQYCKPPAGSFRSLTHLEIVGTNWYREVTTGITRIPGLLTNLETLRYYHTSESAGGDDDAVEAEDEDEDEGEDEDEDEDEDGDEDEDEDEDGTEAEDEGLASTLDRLMREAPKLKVLALGCSESEVDPTELWPLATGSLEHVELWGFSLCGGVGDLLDSCPQWRDSLVCLRIPRHNIPLAELRLLAQCDALQHLRIGLNFSDNVPFAVDLLRPAKPRGLLLESSFALGGLSDESIRTCAKFLLSCWWDIELSYAEHESKTIVQHEAAMSTLRKLVTALAAVRRVHGP
ncbi:hypothetical protein FRC12_012994 [Ceratobasidium sp. 428]|nr:hypothetical protein FRC12_012994 [Ceratobasidium sp. 428]